jgi:outer membrane lipopolysaccharide assembly protein LptE/RlpB
MKYILPYTRYSVILLLFGLAGCSFKLRGIESVPLQLHQLYLQTHNVNNIFRNELIAALQTRGVVLAKSPQQVPYTLRITNTQLNQTLTSTSTDMQVRNYLVSYSLQYQLLNSNGQDLLAPKTLILTKTYVANSTQLLNESYEFSEVRQGLRRDAINQLFERLSVLNLEELKIHNNAT